MGSAQRVTATGPTTSELANRLVAILRALNATAASRPVARLPLKKSVGHPVLSLQELHAENIRKVSYPYRGSGWGVCDKNSKGQNPRKSNGETPLVG